jgi:hypothetical protein
VAHRLRILPARCQVSSASAKNDPTAGECLELDLIIERGVVTSQVEPPFLGNCLAPRTSSASAARMAHCRGPQSVLSASTGFTRTARRAGP